MSRFVIGILWCVALVDCADACAVCEASAMKLCYADQQVSAEVPPPEPQAYTQVGGKWPQPGGLGTPVTLTYSYNNLLDGGLRQLDGTPLPTSVIRASVEEALGLWASVAPLHFVEVPDEGTIPVPRSSYPDGQFGQIRFHHLYINGPDVPGQQPIAKAQAYYPTGGGNLGGDVYFDHSDPWEVSGTLPAPDVLGAAIHELGHTLGLGHSALPNANMYWIFTRYRGPGTGAALHEDDIAGIRAVYGAGVGSVTPLAVTGVPEPAGWVLAGIVTLVVLGQRLLTPARPLTSAPSRW